MVRHVEVASGTELRVVFSLAGKIIPLEAHFGSKAVICPNLLLLGYLLRIVEERLIGEGETLDS